MPTRGTVALEVNFRKRGLFHRWHWHWVVCKSPTSPWKFYIWTSK